MWCALIRMSHEDMASLEQTIARAVTTALRNSGYAISSSSDSSEEDTNTMT